MKKFIALSLVVGSLVFFVVTIAPRGSDRNQNALSLETRENSNSNLSFNTAQNKEISIQTNENGSLSQASDNLTEYIASLYAQSLIKENNIQSSAYNLNALTQLGESDIDTLAKNSLNQTLTSKIFTAKDIRNGTDSSEAAQVQYLELFSTVTKKHFGSFPMSIYEMFES